MARPTEYSDELAAAICARIAEGKSVRQIGRMAGMPSPATIYRWLAAAGRDDFREQYARACEERGEALVEQGLEVAQRVVKRAEKGRADKAEVAAARLLTDTLFRRAGQLAPKKLGPLIKLVGDDEQPIPLVLRRRPRKAEPKG